MTATYMSVKANPANLIDDGAMNVGTSSTSGDYIELRITQGTTGLTSTAILMALENFKRAIVAGRIKGTKFPWI
jgi:hypothetical protein